MKYKNSLHTIKRSNEHKIASENHKYDIMTITIPIFMYCILAERIAITHKHNCRKPWYIDTKQCLDYAKWL